MFSKMHRLREGKNVQINLAISKPQRTQLHNIYKIFMDIVVSSYIVHSSEIV